LPFHQQAADELGVDDLCGAGEEGLGEMLGESDGYGSGFVKLCWGMLSAVVVGANWSYTTLSAMSEEQLKAFLEAVKADAGLQEQLKAATDPGAVVAIAKAAGIFAE